MKGIKTVIGWFVSDLVGTGKTKTGTYKSKQLRLIQVRKGKDR